MAILCLNLLVWLQIVLINISDIQTLTEYHVSNHSVIGSLPTDGHEAPNFDNPLEGFGDFHYPNPYEEEERESERTDNTTEPFHESIKPLDENEMFNTTFEDVLPLGTEDDEGCHCRQGSQAVDAVSAEVFCRCYGESVTQMPTNLTQGLIRL